MGRVGRNDPCPCGSGKKWKKCCLTLEDVAEMPPELHYTLDWHSRDRAYTGEIMQWVQDKHPAWMREAYERIVEETPPKNGSESFEYIASYLLWHYTPTPDGPTVAERYFTALPRRLGERRAWYEAHRRSWLGLWEVRQVEPSRSLQLRDLLTGEERTVTEREGSRCLNLLDNILARVVDLEGVSVLAGLHPLALPPRPTEMARAAFMKCFPRRRRLKPAELRTNPSFLTLNSCWQWVADEWSHRPLPTLVNHHGDPIEWCVDRFTFAPQDRAAVIARLESLGRVEDDGEGVQVSLTELAPAGSPTVTVSVGFIRVLVDHCRAEANSVRRADRLHEQLVERAGDLVAYQGRERKDIRQPQEQPAPPRPAKEPPPPEVMELLHERLRQIQTEHLERWVDMAIPALNGQTPRQAATNREGRKQVRLLLKEMAYSQARAPAERRISLDFVYAELGLEGELMESAPR